MIKVAAADCGNCQSPERHLWVQFGPQRQPELVELESGNWITLLRCQECNSLWCSSPYEPFASYSYAVLWLDDAAAWRRIHDQDAGLTLVRWHGFVVNKYWKTLPVDELEQVDLHRQRSHGRNPIDLPQTFRATDIPV